MPITLQQTLLFLAVLWAGGIHALESNKSGAWFDPAYDGAGFLVEVLAEDRALVYWFTYDDTGSQQWYLGVGSTDDKRIVIDTLQAASGGNFGPDFDPLEVSLVDVGSLTIEFTDCNRALVEFTVNGQAGAQDLTRLTSIDGQYCTGGPPSQKINQSASWFSPDRAGEGFVIELLDAQTAFITYFTFDVAGNPAWFTGLAYVASQSLVVEDLLITRGGRFDAEHDPAAVIRERVGRLEMYLGCDVGRVSYDMDNALPSGGHSLVPLTQLEGVRCEEDQFKAATLTSLEGIWRSDGFGMAAQITPDRTVLYETTNISCVSVLDAPTPSLTAALDGLFVSELNERLQVNGLDSVTPVFFDRSAALPQVCRNGPTNNTSNPLTNYDVFAALVEERYADFGPSEVDWAQQQLRFGPMVGGSTTSQRLFTIFSQMLAPLRDLHTSIENETQFYSAGLSASRIAYFNRAQGAEIDQIVSGYLTSRLFTAAGGAMGFGLLEDGSGYLELRNFTISVGGDSRLERLDFYAREIDRVLDYFARQGVSRLVVDARRNSGGDSSFGFEMASRFLRGQVRTLFSERRPLPGGLTQAYVQQLAPTTRRAFDGDTVLLTGSLTASAGEVFVLGMMASPHITLVGEPTAGILSRIERTLPNGWLLSLTGGQIRTPEGGYFERQGLPVDIPVAVYTDADYASGTDPALEQAMAHLGK